MSDLTGSTVSDRYRFDIRLGEGTFAQVYRVHDIRRNVDLAAKVLRADVAHEPTFLERFRREGEVLARLQHPNIVRYYDLIETDAAVFILMDYVPGETLQARLYNISRPMAVREVFVLLKPLTAALHFAHGEGVIHRDLKPANILLHENGNLLVSDFGIARLLDDATFASSLGQALGTPLYMAPEQITSGEISAATDVYSLGVILYQMLCGTVPFAGRHPAAQGNSLSERITHEHLHLAPTPLRAMESSIPEAVEEVVGRCLAKDPPRRPHSVRDVYDMMAEAIGAAPSDLTPLPPERSVPPPTMHLPEVSQFIRHTTQESDPGAIDRPTLINEKNRVVQVINLVYDDLDPETTPLAHQITIEHERPTQSKNPLRAQTIQNTRPELAGQSALITPPVAPTPPLSFPADVSAAAQTLPPRFRVFRRVRLLPHINVMTAGVIGVLLVTGACVVLALYALSGSSSGHEEPTRPPAPEVPTVTDRAPSGATTGPSPTVAATRVLTTPPAGTLGAGNGDLIAYASSRQNSIFNIFVTHWDGETLRQQLTDNPNLNQTGPAWSPDGTRIAFYAYDDSENADIYVMDANGSNIINLTNTPEENDRYVAWAPDGTRLVFHSNRPGEVDGSTDYELYVYHLSSGSMTQITFNSTDDLGPDWSPDGRRIAFHSFVSGRYRIFTTNVDGTNRQQISPDDLIQDAYFPTWSPDGSQLAFHVRQSGFMQIFVMNADGTDLHPLLQVPVDDRFPDWSPDGQHIIFQRWQNNVYSLQMYNFADNSVTAIGPALGDFLPDWQPVPAD